MPVYIYSNGYNFDNRELSDHPELLNCLRNNRLTSKCLDAVYNEDYRGMAVLEIGYADIELNINVGDNNAPSPEYFICQRYGDYAWNWDSLGYADEFIPIEEAKPRVNWCSPFLDIELARDMERVLRAVHETNGWDITVPWNDERSHA